MAKTMVNPFFKKRLLAKKIIYVNIRASLCFKLVDKLRGRAYNKYYSEVENE